MEWVEGGDGVGKEEGEVYNGKGWRERVGKG
jgi:hypothetical protein